MRADIQERQLSILGALIRRLQDGRRLEIAREANGMAGTERDCNAAVERSIATEATYIKALEAYVTTNELIRCDPNKAHRAA